jgi:16S rRNA (guanine1207-N2)-methyltransferase
MSDELDKGTQYLLSTIMVEPGNIIVDYGSADNGNLGIHVASMYASSKVYLVANDLRTSQIAQQCRREKALHNVSVYTDDSLRCLERTRPTIVIIKPSGYEGNKRIRAKFAESMRSLAQGGSLYFVTNMHKGAPTFMRMLDEIFGNHEVLKRGGGGIRIVRSVKTSEPVEEVHEEQTKSLIEADILGKRYIFQTGQALFSKDKIDKGTLLLLESIKVDNPRSILDLGCGYGVIGVVMADRLKGAKVTLVDVDMQAVKAAAANAHLNGFENNTSIIMSDGLKELPKAEFDLILSHFPLHIPQEEQVRLLKESRNALNHGGKLCLVALSSYDLRPMLQSIFGNIHVVADSNQKENPAERYTVLSSIKD